MGLREKAIAILVRIVTVDVWVAAIARAETHLSTHWSYGLRTHHGLMSNGFPNYFFMGFAQTAITVNVPHALIEQAHHVAYILSELHKRRKKTVETNAEAEQAYVDEIERLSISCNRFYNECTPGYYNSEGKPGNKDGFFSNMHGAGPIKFFQLFKHWRDQGELEEDSNY